MKSVDQRRDCAAPSIQEMAAAILQSKDPRVKDIREALVGRISDAYELYEARLARPARRLPHEAA